MKKAFKSVVLALALLVLVTACAKGPKVEQGALVTFNYTGTLKDGTKFDSTEGKQPVAAVIGSGQLRTSFEKMILGMRINNKKKFTIKAKDTAFGEADPKKVITLPRDQRFGNVQIVEGGTITATQKLPNGQTVSQVVKIVKANDKEITLDTNHPLAGKDLTFEVTIVGISDSPSKQLQAGQQIPVDMAKVNIKTAG